MHLGTSSNNETVQATAADEGYKEPLAIKIVRIVSILLVITGLSALAFINVENWLAQKEASEHIQEFSAIYENLDDPERIDYKLQAESYNRNLAGEEIDVDLLPYREQLFYQHEPMMSYIDIPQVDLKLPIYHGTADTELMSGIGHLESSSLPIGGNTSHCVLLGHSGMRNIRMFDDLKKLEPGDRFVIWTLNEPYAYEVKSSKTMLPEEAEEQTGLEAGKDLVTLITCTPAGINTHRLVVRCERCAYDAEEIQSQAPAVYITDNNRYLIGGLAIVLVVAVVSGFFYVIRRRSRNSEPKK